MRHYAPNSPEAAARIVALSLFADREIDGQELERLKQLEVDRKLGLSTAQLNEVFDQFLEDLLSSEQLQWADACPVDEHTLGRLLGDIDSPLLRLRVMCLCVELIEADGWVDAGESAVLAAAGEHWGLPYTPAAQRNGPLACEA